MLGKMAGKAHQSVGEGNRAIHRRIAGIAVSLPHLMFFQDDKSDSAWGANVANAPVMSVNYWRLSDAYPQLKNFPPLSVFLVMVPKWSDGTNTPAM